MWCYHILITHGVIICLLYIIDSLCMVLYYADYMWCHPKPITLGVIIYQLHMVLSFTHYIGHYQTHYIWCYQMPNTRGVMRITQGVTKCSLHNGHGVIIYSIHLVFSYAHYTWCYGILITNVPSNFLESVCA